MTIHRNINKAGLGGNHVMWWLKKTLTDAGHSVTASGSGTSGTYSAVGDVFDPAGGNPYQTSLGIASGKLGSGAGTEPFCAAAKAWFLITMLNGHQWLFQRDSGAADTDDDEWTIAFDPGGGFNLAGCAAAIAPSLPAGTAPKLFCGTINGAGVALFAAGGTADMIHVMADDAPNSDGEYSVALVEFIAPNTLKGVFIIDAVNQRKSDLWAACAQIMVVGTGSAVLVLNLANPTATYNYPMALVDYGGGSQAWRGATYFKLDNGTGGVLYPAGAGVPSAGQPDMPIIVGFPAHGGMGGVSDLMLWQAATRVYPDTNVALTGWYIGDVLLMIGDGATAPTAIP